MTQASLLNQDWCDTIERLGGAAALNQSAKQTKAFLRAREFEDAISMLRMILAYCLGDVGLRSTAAWAASIGLADVANTALLYRLRKSTDWFVWLVGQLLGCAAPKASQGRLIRIVDATTMLKAGADSKTKNKLWRVHSAFDLPCERFGFFELTDEHGGERLDRVPVIEGEIRLADRAYMQPERIAAVMEAGADVVIRSGWKNAHWLDGAGNLFDMIENLKTAEAKGQIDRPIWIGRKSGPALSLRLIAVRKPAHAWEAAQRAVRKQAQKSGYQVSKGTLLAAEWVILVTSLSPEAFSTDDVLALYRLRWRIELAFKRLKSVVGLKTPPGIDERSAKPYILAHLLVILLLEPLIDELESSPPLAQAA